MSLSFQLSWNRWFDIEGKFQAVYLKNKSQWRSFLVVIQVKPFSVKSFTIVQTTMGTLVNIILCFEMCNWFFQLKFHEVQEVFPYISLYGFCIMQKFTSIIYVSISFRFSSCKHLFLFNRSCNHLFLFFHVFLAGQLKVNLNH